MFVEGSASEDAFALPQANPIDVPVEPSVPVTEADTHNVDKSFQKKRGQAPVVVEKPKKEAAPRKK